MLVWGGATADYPTTYLNTGGRYDPAHDAWSPISMTGSPSPRYGHSILWDGHEAIIWGGAGDTSSGLDTGGRYDPIPDAWSPTSTVATPVGRAGPELRAVLDTQLSRLIGQPTRSGRFIREVQRLSEVSE